MRTSSIYTNMSSYACRNVLMIWASLLLYVKYLIKNSNIIIFFFHELQQNIININFFYQKLNDCNIEGALCIHTRLSTHKQYNKEAQLIKTF